MGHGTDKHLEHAEHAQHHAQNPFDRNVAVSMALIAAALAGVTLLSHRGHTETLRLATEANQLHTKASDQWNFYQAKNIRSYEFKGFVVLLDAILQNDGYKEAGMASRKKWLDQVERYEVKAGEKKEGKKRPGDGELDQIKADAENLQHKGEAKELESHHVHDAVNFLDYGHLAVELALVLCAVAVLTKVRSFWFTGVLVALLGLAVASVGMYKWSTIDVHHEKTGQKATSAH